MTASSHALVLDLHWVMLRDSKHFSSYNYRTYVVRRIRDDFIENKKVKDPVEIQTLVNKIREEINEIKTRKRMKPGSGSMKRQTKLINPLVSLIKNRERERYKG
uniref:Complex 1 LYR protein domain-containing protein n=1 Tax=Felis catus TaxID=9685 RepID=A0ABI7Y5I3_FELCA